ncbi:glycosyltransferase family 1 protein [Bifidobacterium criceti]|nr:glycosyltransferase family 1 protein [Bifidobacterium criceti]
MWGGGGVEATTMNHYRLLDHSKIHYDFIVYEGSPYVPIDEIKKLGGRVFYVPPITHLAGFEKELARILKTTNPDIVHSNLNALSIFPLRVAKRIGIPVRIAHSHSTSNNKELLRNTAKKVLRLYSKTYPTHLAACSLDSATWLFGKKAVAEHNVHYIKNAIDLQRYAFNASHRLELRKKYGLEDKHVLGQIGRFTTQKNYSFSMDVVAELVSTDPNAVFVALGSGNLMRAIRQKAAALGIADHVMLLGNQSNANAWYSAFDALLFPSLYEGLPLTMIEAQVAGLPIVSSDKVTPEAFIDKELVTVLPLELTTAAWAHAVTDAFSQSNHSRCVDVTQFMRK